MPSVGSTPTTSSPALQQQHSTQSLAPLHTTTHLPPQHSSSIALQQQHAKIQQQHSLPLQLQYQVTTTQPSPAGMFISQTAGIISSTAALGNTSSFFNNATSGADISPTSSTASFSSVDTNQTLLNSIANQQQASTAANHSSSSHKASYSSGHSSSSKAVVPSTNRSYRTKYSQFMIITPAVSIDRDFDRTDNLSSNAADNHGFHTAEDDPYFPHNGNIFRFNNLQTSIDSGNSSDSGSFRSNYNPYLHNSRQHLLPKSAPPFYNFSPSSWRWCNLICAAMRCFGAGGGGGAGSGRNRSGLYSSTSFGRPPYQRSRSSGPHTSSKTPHRRLRSYSTSSFTPETAFEHFSAPFKARKTRDEQNNIAYEL
uniref:Uncharacterized protein n=3 Tax=Stomoxys calcitrans TaxID=35570 RepID=A0A1I8PCY6_STOCA